MGRYFQSEQRSVCRKLTHGRNGKSHKCVACRGEQRMLRKRVFRHFNGIAFAVYRRKRTDRGQRQEQTQFRRKRGQKLIRDSHCRNGHCRACKKIHQHSYRRRKFFKKHLCKRFGYYKRTKHHRAQKKSRFYAHGNGKHGGNADYLTQYRVSEKRVFTEERTVFFLIRIHALPSPASVSRPFEENTRLPPENSGLNAFITSTANGAPSSNAPK